MAIENRTAIVIGSTGVTGSALLVQLCNSPIYTRVISFSRKQPSFEHSKLVSHIVDFENLDAWATEPRGDDLFSALGTTRKTAGSLDKQYRIDHDYQIEVMKAAAANGVERLFLVSSPNASSKSLFFYTRMKGNIEDAARAMPFKTKVFIQPSLIVGERPDKRRGESIAASASKGIMKASALIPSNKLRQAVTRVMPITGQELASGIVAIAERPLGDGVHIYAFDQIARA